MLLPKLGLCHKRPLALQHALEARGGYELPAYATKQTIVKLKQVIQLILWMSDVGILLIIHLTWTQLHTGLDKPILMDTESNISYIQTNTWTKIQESLKQFDGRFKLEYNYTPTTPRLNN